MNISIRLICVDLCVCPKRILVHTALYTQIVIHTYSIHYSTHRLSFGLPLSVYPPLAVAVALLLSLLLKLMSPQRAGSQSACGWPNLGCPGCNLFFSLFLKTPAK